MKIKLKSFLSFILSLIIVFSVFPSTVFAKDYDINTHWDIGFYNEDMSQQSFVKNVSFPYTFTKSNVNSNGGDSSHYDDTLKYHHGLKAVFRTTSYEMKENIYHIDDGGTLSFELFLWEDGRIEDVLAELRLIYIDSSGVQRSKKVDSLNYSNGHLTLDDYVFEDGIDFAGFYVEAERFRVTSGYETLYARFTSCEFSIKSADSGMLSSIKNFFHQLFERLTNGFEAIGSWFSDLGDKIGSFFINLINNIRSFFTDLKNNLKELFDNVGQWFQDIGDKISGFFEKLWNRIWWGNENGESEYQKPVINNKLNDILDKLQEYQDNLKSAISTINSASDDVAAYISTGTELVNGVIGVAGAGFTALIVFGIVFILVRKVVGR